MSNEICNYHIKDGYPYEVEEIRWGRVIQQVVKIEQGEHYFDYELKGA